jgi:hypothetical protein
MVIMRLRLSAINRTSTECSNKRNRTKSSINSETITVLQTGRKHVLDAKMVDISTDNIISVVQPPLTSDPNIVPTVIKVIKNSYRTSDRSKTDKTTALRNNFLVKRSQAAEFVCITLGEKKC